MEKNINIFVLGRSVTLFSILRMRNTKKQTILMLKLVTQKKKKKRKTMRKNKKLTLIKT